ncbi:MAG: BamA/TamA family outer membrane protein [Planctomycetota bacterium]|nr:BamA/TamA family outer membrane protein [Planctomycetota bacterium]
MSARRLARARPHGVRPVRIAWLAVAGLLLLVAAPLVVSTPALQSAAYADPPPPPPPPPNWPPDGRSQPAPRQPAPPQPRQPVQPVQPPRPAMPAAPRDDRVPPPPPPPDVVPRRPLAPVPAPRPATPAAPQPAPIPAQPAAPDDQPPAPRDPNAPAPIIRRIEFEGTVVYSPSSIKVLMRNKEGQRLDEVALEADMVTLFQYFREVDIRQEEVPGGIVLRIRVAENPLVVELNVRGNAALEAPEIRELMRTKVGFPLNPYHLSEDAQDIVAAYKLRGYHFAHVTEPQITTLANGGRRVDIAIVEGPEVEVERIVFRGNFAIPQKKLREVMLIKEPEGLQAIFGGAPYREDALIEDVIAIKQAYRDEGYLDAEVFLDTPRFSDDKSKVIVSIVIEEHQPYRLGRLELEIERYEENPAIGPTLEDIQYFTVDRLRSWIPLEDGGAFSGTKLKEGIEKIRDEYFKRSYLEASIDIPEQRGREDELVVDLKIVVKEGPKLRIARIDFVGNEYTRDKILRREVKLSPGGYVDRGELERGEARIRRTGWFDRVSMRMSDAFGPDDEPLEGWKSVVYEVVEGKTGNFNFGLGISTNGGAFGSIQFTKRNFDLARPPRSTDELISRRTFTGAGQEFDIFIQPSTVESAFRVRFREPRLFGSLLSFETAAYKTFSFRDDYVVDRAGYTVAFGYPLYESRDERNRLTTNLRWRHEWIDINDLEADAIPGAFLFRDEQELRGLSASLRYSARDDIRTQRWEFSASAVAELAGTALGGDLDFYKLNGSLSYRRVLSEDDEGKRQRFSSRLNLGYGEALEDTPELPPYERYYAGGSTFRGFAFRGVGPHVAGDPIGGEWLLTGSLEYEYPLIAKTLGVVAFTDFGTVATSLWEDDAGDWRLSVGFGIRLVVPMLGSRPLAFDFGFPIFSEDEDDEQVVSFNLGRDF